MPPKVRTVVLLPVELLALLEAKARETGTSVSALVRSAVERVHGS